VLVLPYNGAADKPPAGDPRSGTEAGRLHPHDGQREARPSAGGNPPRRWRSAKRLA